MPIHPPNSPHAPRAAHAPGVAPLLRVAKRLHRAAVSSSLAESLPVLRRLLAAQVIRGLTLPQLSQRRSLIQRKHLLHTLAIEAGFLNWDAYRGALAETPHDPPLPFDVHTRAAGYPNLWMNLGQGSLGFTLAAGSAVVLSALLNGASPAISLEGLTWEHSA